MYSLHPGCQRLTPGFHVPILPEPDNSDSCGLNPRPSEGYGGSRGRTTP